MHPKISGHDASPLTAALKQLPGFLRHGVVAPFDLQRVASIEQTDAPLLDVVLGCHLELSCALVGHIERTHHQRGAAPAVSEGVAQLHVEAKLLLWCDGRRRARRWWLGWLKRRQKRRR